MVSELEGLVFRRRGSILVALVLVTRLVPPLRDALQSIDITWEAADGTFSGSFQPFYHPGTMLFISFLLSPV